MFSIIKFFSPLAEILSDNNHLNVGKLCLSFFIVLLKNCERLKQITNLIFNKISNYSKAKSLY